MEPESLTQEAAALRAAAWFERTSGYAPLVQFARRSPIVAGAWLVTATCDEREGCFVLVVDADGEAVRLASLAKDGGL